MPPPIPVEPAGEHPEELVPAVPSWAAPGSEGDLALLAQEEILEKEVVLAGEASKKRAEQEPEEGEHRIRIAGLTSASGPVLSLPSYAIMVRYQLTDRALQRLAKIVHGADVSADINIVPESAGLQAIARGFALAHGENDHEKIRLETPIYDALYVWCQDQVKQGR